MHRMGVKVAVTFPNTVKKGKAWPIIRGIIPDAEEHTLRQIIILHRPDEIDAIAAKWDVVVATFCLTVDTVSKVHTQYPHILPAYYVQDYEPWFKSSPFDPVKDDDWFRKVGATYTANKPNAVLFAKTQWTAHMVTSIHNVTVHPVTPSLDHDIYYPNRTELAAKLRKTFAGKRTQSAQRTQQSAPGTVFRILAMIRPKTPRRNPIDTLDVALRLAHDMEGRVQILLFGSEKEDMLSTLSKLIASKGKAPHRSKALMRRKDRVKILGLLVNRAEIADMYRQIDIFIDLSWWQAFGRAALEAMACGSVALMPSTGAAAELCHGGLNCLYHDGKDVDGVYQKLQGIMQNDTIRHNMIRRGLERTAKFTIPAAAASIANQLKRGYAAYKATRVESGMGSLHKLHTNKDRGIK
mmetsp:Transcript_8623/g.14330  ORF Transcript_8623/g.14330 Transcript_8623/m.14330 type:complete len:409 (-) Transcript_8623:450-1676(-)